MGWGVSQTHEVLVMIKVTNHWTKVLILLTECYGTIKYLELEIIINKKYY